MFFTFHDNVAGFTIFTFLDAYYWLPEKMCLCYMNFNLVFPKKLNFKIV